MNNLLLKGIAVSLLSLGLVTSALAADDAVPAGKEKCYGIAMPGQNEGRSADGMYEKGQSPRSNHPADWSYVNMGECVSKGGKTEYVAPAK